MRICPQCSSVHAPRAVVCVRDGTDLVDSDVDPLIGRPLDRYVIEEKLGEGGMGCVYRARHTVLDREYAIKVLFADFATDERFLARFRREAQSMSRVRHENIVNVEDFGTSPEGQTFLAMELVRGPTLEAVIARDAPLPPARAAKLVRQMAAGLAAAHQGGFVHRDVKPSNMMIERKGTTERLKILDFGAVNLRSLPSNERLTHVGHIIGTPTYMAPEQSQDPNVGPTADLYAVGVVLYEMLTGEPPFTGEGRAEVLVQHITMPAPELPPRAGLERLVAWLLRKLPSERPQSGTQVVEALDHLALEREDDEQTAVTPLEVRAFGRPSPTDPTPPTRSGDEVGARDLRQLYAELRDRPPPDTQDLLSNDTFPVLDSGLDWAQLESNVADDYQPLDAETDDDGRPAPPLIAEDLVVEVPALSSPDGAGRAAYATEIVRERVVSNPRAEITDPFDMFQTAPTPLAPTHESDDGGPTQVDFEIEPSGPLPEAEPIELPDTESPSAFGVAARLEAAARLDSTTERPRIEGGGHDLNTDTSATLLEADTDEPGGTVPLQPSLHFDGDVDRTRPPMEPDELPTTETPPPDLSGASTLPADFAARGVSAVQPPPAATRARRAWVYYAAIAALSALILALGWVLISGRQPIDLGAESSLSAPK